MTFEVNLKAPTVVLTRPTSPSHDVEPSFSGTVSGPSGETVTVLVYPGTLDEGETVGRVTATLKAGSWKSAPFTPALASGDHTFTAVATVPSSIGNGTGKSAPETFVVNSEAPTVTLRQPKTPSNEATPTFSGTASEKTPVVVSIYAGPTATGTVVAKATAAGTEGEWSSPSLSTSLEDGEYTAVATQESAIGNGTGSSSPVSFTVDTKPPRVTLNGLPSPSSDRRPAFSGTASEGDPVTLSIYKGGTATGTPVLILPPAEVSGGEWFSANVPEALEFGEYTAVASEPSSLGNDPGVSQPVTFVVEQIPPGAVTEGSNGISRTYATLYAAVNPVGGPVSACNIEVGTTSSYGRSIGCGFVSGALSFPAQATGFVPVFIRIYTLTPGTVYHYRVVATGEGGTGVGTDKTFVTLPPLTPPVETKVPTETGMTGVAALFAAQLKPSGKGARIGAILKAGLFKSALQGA